MRGAVARYQSESWSVEASGAADSIRDAYLSQVFVVGTLIVAAGDGGYVIRRESDGRWTRVEGPRGVVPRYSEVLGLPPLPSEGCIVRAFAGAGAGAWGRCGGNRAFLSDGAWVPITLPTRASDFRFVSRVLGYSRRQRFAWRSTTDDSWQRLPRLPRRVVGVCGDEAVVFSISGQEAFRMQL
jgi:hypothetical protein